MCWADESGTTLGLPQAHARVKYLTGHAECARQGPRDLMPQRDDARCSTWNRGRGSMDGDMHTRGAVSSTVDRARLLVAHGNVFNSMETFSTTFHVKQGKGFRILGAMSRDRAQQPRTRIAIPRLHIPGFHGFLSSCNRFHHNIRPSVVRPLPGYWNRIPLGYCNISIP